MMTAGQDLRSLVQTGLVKQTGFGRWTKYILKSPDIKIDDSVLEGDEEKVISFIVKHGSINNSECRKLLNVNDDRAYYLLRKLTEKGEVKAQKKGKGRRHVMP